MSDAIYVAKETFQTKDLIVAKGATVREGHPFLKRFPHMFRVLVVDYEVEGGKSAPQSQGPAPVKDDPKPSPAPKSDSGGGEGELPAAKPGSRIPEPKSGPGTTDSGSGDSRLPAAKPGSKVPEPHSAPKRPSADGPKSK